MFFMYFLISFNYNALRAYKDSMVITASDSGAAVLPFIKLWAILPGAFLLTFVFTRLANRYSREKLFYTMMGLFLGFFFIFAFVLFPAQEYLHPHKFADQMAAYLPEGFKGLIAVFRNWTFTLFYVMSELWSTAIMAVLFWGFANEVTTVGEAKRYYILWSIGANIAGFFSGLVAVYFSGGIFVSWLPYGKNAWDQSVCFLCCSVIISGLITMGIFRWLNKRVIRPSEDIRSQETKPEKIKMSMRKNFAYLAKSRYLICIALIVLCYNIGINLVEVVWKNQVHQLYPDPNQFSSYMGKVMSFNGLSATIISIFITGNLIRRLSWTVSALLTPLITLLPGLGFFLFTIFQGSSSWAALAAGSTPLVMSVFLGSLHNCTTRSCKYTLFDATKEMSFIPLNKESKLKGKAAIDGVGSRIGKSGGSLIYQGLLFSCSTVSATAPFVAGIFLVVVLVWVLATVTLGKQFEELAQENGKLSIQESSPKLKPVLSKARS